ncbi:hypothetical protein ACJA88_014672 [Fusarium oxysporum]
MQCGQVDNSAIDLTNQLDDMIKERDQLASTLASVKSILARCIPSSGQAVTQWHDTPSYDNNLETWDYQAPEEQSPASANRLCTPFCISEPLLPRSKVSAFGDQPSEQQESFFVRSLPMIASMIEDPNRRTPTQPFSATVTDVVIVPESDAPCACILTAPTIYNMNASSGNIWRAANKVLGGYDKLSGEEVLLEVNTNEDIPVRVILEGWDQYENNTHGLSPLWRRLRHIDELQFRRCLQVERLAIMVLMHRQLCSRLGSNQDLWAKLPLWLLSRPSQVLPHSSAIDFFAWPGVRERFVFAQHRYCSNKFWDIFADCFRFLWPFQFRDCYMVDRATGRISLSPQFENRIQDIASWAMTTDFFSYFPEMYGDIPSFESSPCRQLPTHHFGSLDRHVRGEKPYSSSALSQEADSYSCSRPPYS